MPGSKIPFFGLKRQYANLKDELLSMIDLVYSSGQVLDGEYVGRFECEMAGRTKRDFAVAVNSCSMALLFAYIYYIARIDSKNLALPTVSFIATLNAPSLSGYETRFVDVDEDGIMDISKLELKGDKIGLISYVNLFGNVIDYDKLRIVSQFFDKNIPIIEDAAQSFGASYKGIPSGKLGDVSVLSFDPTKNLPNYGSGGMILTDDEDLYQFASSMRDNGRAAGRKVSGGTNAKMSESDCAQMLVKLEHFDEWQVRRTKIAEFYNDCLGPYAITPKPAPNVVHAWHKYVIQTTDQYRLGKALAEERIETKVHYSRTLPQQQGSNITYEVSERLAMTSLSLPIYPELTDAEVEHIVKTIQDFYD